MELQIIVEGEKFSVSIGKGYGDFAWLANYAAKVYGGRIYPKGNYIPLFLKLDYEGSTYVPHPRKKISMYMQENNLKAAGLIVTVPIRKANQALTEGEESNIIVIQDGNGRLSEKRGI
jgi:hypothetical protein